MPELAEIEVIRRALVPFLVGRTLRVEHVGQHDLRARGGGRGSLGRGAWMTPDDLLDGAVVAKLVRHGKRLGIVARDGRCLVVQLGMSGALLASRKPRGKHVHVEWSVSGRRLPLRFEDPRRFGGLRALRGERRMLDEWCLELGPDALAVAGSALAERLVGRRCVKAALLDQRVVAGVGNIYADESLHRAGIDPRTHCGRISCERVTALAESIRTTLRQAIRSGGSSIRDYRPSEGRLGSAQELHAVYGRGGQPCRQCGSAIRSAPIAGRTTCWCPGCQRRGK